MKNNFISLFKNFSIKDFENNVSFIQKEIKEKKEFKFNLEKKDINVFFIIIQKYGFNLAKNLDYIKRNKNLNDLIIKKHIKCNNFKKLYYNQFILLFIYIYCHHKKNTSIKTDNVDNNNNSEKKYKEMFNDLYLILLKIYSSTFNKDNHILDINDMSEIFRFIINSSLEDLLNNNHIFNLSIIHLTEFLIDKNLEELNQFYTVFEQLYNKLLNNEKQLIFLKRDKDIENFSIFKLIKIACLASSGDNKLKNEIFKILNLIYKNDYSNNLSSIILNNIKECFYELKNNNKNKIINCIKYLSSLVEFNNYLFINEEQEKLDVFMPSNYFVFDGSKDSGIYYDSKYELFKNSFTLVFSFKIEEMQENKIYPLITFISQNKKNEIIFNIFIKNNELCLYDNLNISSIDSISNKTSYIIVIEFLLNEKIIVSINEEKKEITSYKINNNSKISIEIGYIKNEALINKLKNFTNFKGIIGPILFFNNIKEEKDFVTNILKLKGRYEYILLFNNENDLKNYNYYEECNFDDDPEFIKAHEYFSKISKKIEEVCLFTICPLSIINSIDQNTDTFIQDIYKKNNNIEISSNFNIQKCSSKNNGIYAKINRKSISIFVEYDGIYIYTLIIEYFYNLLRMPINEPKKERILITNHIYDALCPILTSIFKILCFFRIDSFSNDLDTFEFSLKKLFCLLVDTQAINLNLIETLYNIIFELLNNKKITKSKTSGTIISIFINRLFALICSSIFVDNMYNNYKKSANLFKLLSLIIENNDSLINVDVMNILLYSCFILNTNSLDKHNNKKERTTFKKNPEYLEMKREYKNLLCLFIKQFNNFDMYIKYIQFVCKKNINMLEKYRLMKIYYENHDLYSIYDNYLMEKKESNNSYFSIFNKKDKNNNNKYIYTEKDLQDEYENNLSKLIDMSQSIESINKRPYELLKCIFILLIYEHHKIISMNINNKENSQLSQNKNESKNSNTSNHNNSKDKNKISFFSSDTLETVKQKKKKLELSNSPLLNFSPSSIKMEKSADYDDNDSDYNDLRLDYSLEDNNNFSFEKNEKAKKNTILKENYIFDILLKSKSYSFYIIKAIFSCLYDQMDKSVKILLIKNEDENYTKFDLYFGECSRYKKELLSQCLKIIELLNNKYDIIKSFKFIFAFMNQSITMFKNKSKNKYSKSILLHLFESKKMLNNFFYFCINNEIKADKSLIDKYVISPINHINNEILVLHPRPYIFSFIKKCIKNGNTQITKIIENICDFIVESIKNNTIPELKLNNYLYSNVIRFIKTLINSFDNYQTNAQKLLINDNFKLYVSIQEMIIQLSKSPIIYDTNIYFFNPYIFFETSKKKSEESKVLSNHIIYLNLFELSIISSFLISNQNVQIKEKNYLEEYSSKIYKAMSFNNHFISYYFDISNLLIHFNIKKDIPKDIKNLLKDKEIDEKYQHYLNTKETKLISALLYLIILKYQSLLINLEKYNISKPLLNRNIFDKYVNLSENDIISLFSVINKKDFKKHENIIGKDESKSKTFKEYYRNYYKNLIDSILTIKKKNILTIQDIQNIRKRIEDKFIKEDLEKKRKSISLLKSNTSIYNENNNLSGQKSGVENKEKRRKDSFGYYNDEKEEISDLNNIGEYIRTNSIKEKNKDIENKNRKKYNIIDSDLLDFENANNPILCTKRDLVLKNFGYIYYNDFFKDNKFIKMKKMFLYLYNPKKKNYNYNGFQKLMKNKYPYTIKNFSNHTYYYPRMIFRPYKKFFDDKYFSISHKYFKDKLKEYKNDEKIFHLEYGHGLLNQYNLDLFTLSHNNKAYSNIMDINLTSNLRKKSDDINEEFSKTTKIIKNSEFEEIMGLYENKIKNKEIKSFHDTLRKHNPIFNNNKEDITSKNNYISRKKIYIFSSINKLDKQNITLYECERICPKNSSHGILALTKYYLIYQVDTKFDIKKYDTDEKYIFSSSQFDLDKSEKQIIIPYNLISQILYRKFLFFNQSLELFLFNGKSYFFNLYREDYRNLFMNSLIEKIKTDRCEIIEDSAYYFNKGKYLNSWQEGKITTLEYLLLVNKFSNRSYNVLTQYLVLPWVLLDFNNIYEKKNYRDMSLPIVAQTEKAREILENDFKENGSQHFLRFYSTRTYVNYYLIRCYPYINNQIQDQNGNFDEPNRQFDSLQGLCNIFNEDKSQNMELIPEFYYIPEMFLNLNYCFYGKNIEEKTFINNVMIGEGFKSILHLINFQESLLNSDTFNSTINKWIDNIFGKSQIPDKKNKFNSYQKECYEANIKNEINENLKQLELLNEKTKHSKGLSNLEFSLAFLNKNDFKSIDIKPITQKQIINDIHKITNITYGFGICPSQLFKKEHPCPNKKSDIKIYNSSNNVKNKIILKNACINLNEENFLYIRESTSANYFYILFENSIAVYDKKLKLINNLSINSINKIYPPYSYIFKDTMKNTSYLQYMYKYLIFDILDCKYFFVAGYLDNSFRIYTKEKEKDIKYSIYTENKVTCIRKYNNSNLFFTGHKNGKLIKWIYLETNNDNLIKDPLINVKKISSLCAHQTSVKIIEISDKYEYIVTADEEGLIFIRKLYDFELLSYIKINKYKKQVIDINLNNQIIILSVYIIEKKLFVIYTYSLNGLKLGKLDEKIKLPINVMPETDVFMIFGLSNICLINMSFNERISLINYLEADDSDDNFSEIYKTYSPISFFYDIKNRVLFSLFSNGILYRVNLIKNL